MKLQRRVAQVERGSGHMKEIFLLVLISFVLANDSPVQICREVVWYPSGRVVQTIERKKQAGRNERAVICDASGRITGTAITQASGSTTHGSGGMGICKVCNCRA